MKSKYDLFIFIDEVCGLANLTKLWQVLIWNGAGADEILHTQSQTIFFSSYMIFTNTTSLQILYLTVEWIFTFIYCFI